MPHILGIPCRAMRGRGGAGGGGYVDFKHGNYLELSK